MHPSETLISSSLLRILTHSPQREKSEGEMDVGKGRCDGWESVEYRWWRWNARLGMHGPPRVRRPEVRLTKNSLSKLTMWVT